MGAAPPVVFLGWAFATGTADGAGVVYKLFSRFVSVDLELLLWIVPAPEAPPTTGFGAATAGVGCFGAAGAAPTVVTPDGFVGATTGGGCCLLLCGAVDTAAAVVLATMLDAAGAPAAFPALSSASLSESEKDPSIRRPSMLAIFGFVCFVLSLLCRCCFVFDSEMRDEGHD